MNKLVAIVVKGSVVDVVARVNRDAPALIPFLFSISPNPLTHYLNDVCTTLVFKDMPELVGDLEDSRKFLEKLEN